MSSACLSRITTREAAETQPIVFSTDSQAIQSLAISGLLPFVTSSLTLIAMLIVTARLDGRLALLAVALLLPLYGLVRASRGSLHRQWTLVKQSESSAMSVIQEVLGSLRVVKAFGQEEREQSRFVDHSTRMTSGQIKLAGTQGAFDLLVGLIIAFGMATALFVGAMDVRSGTLTVGELLLVMTYMTQLLTPIETITRRFAQIQGSLASAARALALLDERPDVEQIPNARPLGRANGAIRFEHVAFGYQPDRPVLHDISFEITPGTRVGISGRTGAGKTTLVNLLMRFYDPTHGRILLDGVTLADYRLSDVRNQFAIVLQEPVLFSTSIGENIAYARPGATFDDIVAAAKAASAHEFISALPDGYDDPGRGAWIPAVGRRASTHLDSASVSQGRANPHPRRTDQFHRHPDRTGHHDCDGAADAPSDNLHDCPSAVDARGV